MAMSSFWAIPAMSIVVPMRPHPMIAICTLLLGAVAPNTLAGTITGATPAANTPFRKPLLSVCIVFSLLHYTEHYHPIEGRV